MYTTIGAEDMWKGALSGLTNFMGTLNTLPKAFGKIPIGAISMLYDVVNVIKTNGNTAIEGVSKGLLSSLFDDKDINIDWEIDFEPILSEKDKIQPKLQEINKEELI